MLDVANENTRKHPWLVKHNTFWTWPGNQGKAGVRYQVALIKALCVPFCGYNEARIRTQLGAFSRVLQTFKAVWSCSPVILIVHIHNFCISLPSIALSRDGKTMFSVAPDEAWRWRRHTTVGHMCLLAMRKSMAFGLCQVIPGRTGTYMTSCTHFIFFEAFLSENRFVSSSRNLPAVLHCLFIVITSVAVGLWHILHNAPANDVQGLSYSRMRAGRHKHLHSLFFFVIPWHKCTKEMK